MAFVIRLASRRVATPSLARSFSISASVKKDLVQDLYVSQLKNYKPAPTTKDAHNGHVRNYTAPTPPKAPVLPTDLAGELSKFDSEEPTFTAAAPKAAAPTEGGEGADEFLAFLEKDKPSADAHH